VDRSEDAEAKSDKKEPEETQKKKRHWIRWTILCFLAVVILLIVFAPSIVSTPWGNDIVRGIIADQVKRPVRMEKLEIGWFSGIEIRKLQIDRRDGTGHLVKLEKLSGVIGWWPLLAQQLRIGNVKIEGLEVVVTRDAEGKLNIDDLIGGDSSATTTASRGDGMLPVASLLAAADAGDGSGGSGGLHWITNGSINAVLTGSKITYKDEKADAEIVVDEIHIPIELSKEIVITDASLKINGGPVEIERIVYGLVGDQPPIEVKVRASDITMTAAPPPVEPPPFIKPLLQIRESIPLLGSEGEDVVGGTLEQFEVDIKGKANKDGPGGFDLDGTMLMKAEGGKLSTSKGVGRLLRELLGWNSLDAGQIETNTIQIADGKIRIVEQITIRGGQSEILIKGGSVMDGELDYSMVLNPKAHISGVKRRGLGKAVLRTGVLAFKITGTTEDPKLLPDPAGVAENAFVRIFGRPTSNPFVREGSFIERIGYRLRGLPRPPLPGQPKPEDEE
jgi:hypothetical protein